MPALRPRACRSIVALAVRLSKSRGCKRVRKALIMFAVVVTIGAIPAVALAHFSSSTTATMTVSSGPLPPTGVAISCTGVKLTVTWTAPVGLPPASYTLWVTLNGKEPYALVELPIAGSQTSAEIAAVKGYQYIVVLKAVYGSWTSGFSAPSASLKC
jgi:hypothetical protein